MSYFRKKMIKVMAVMLAVSGMIMGGSIALADTSSGSITVGRGESVNARTETEKTTATGTDAKITITSVVPTDDTISVNILNKYGNLACAEAATFRAIRVSTTKTLTYMDGKGKKGNLFRPVFGMSNSSRSDVLDVTYTFTP